jgi:hypothetical protein
MFLLPSVGLDVLFLSRDRLSNVLDGDDSCLHTHLVNHRLSADGMSAFEARQFLAFHLLTGMCMSVTSILPGKTQYVGCRSLGSAFAVMLSYPARMAELPGVGYIILAWSTT